jgi:hypothetical protein
MLKATINPEINTFFLIGYSLKNTDVRFTITSL